MRFHSVPGNSSPVDFSTALLSGLAPDGDLYVPEKIPKLSQSFLDHVDQHTLHELAFQTTSKFLTDVPEEVLREIIRKALSFPIPLVQLEERLYLLELFHGPTLAFKDVGARFMAEVLSYILSQQQRKVTILVATSGDTGSAVAHGFFGVPHITVYVLYPSGRISHLQEQQMTTLGGNIHAVEVEGTFDDCQQLVKRALIDKEILATRPMSTANSINIGRLLPQIVYYVWGYSQWKRLRSTGFEPPVAVVPSGNFGNLTAAAYAKWMGVPLKSLVAATNANDVVPKYLHTGTFAPQPSVQTLSNAMDVGNPSNLSRLQFLYGNDLSLLRREIEGVSISDEVTLKEIRQTYHRGGYVLDPHTAVGVAAARKLSSFHDEHSSFIVTSTAHPAKFPDVIQRAIDMEIPLPPSLQEALARRKQSTLISSEYEQLKELLLT